MKIIISIFLILFSSCLDERSNPLLSGHKAYVEDIYMNGPTRGLQIIENITAEDFHYFPINHSCTDGGIDGPDDCNGYWCEWNENTSSCSYKTKDLLILSNEGDGLFIYEIIEEPSFSLNRVYFEDNIESPEDEFDEPDLELRGIHYSENHNTIYMLDKFEKIYYLYLPHALSHRQENICSSVQEDAFESIKCDAQLNNATQFAMNENNPNNYGGDFPFEMFILYKHNELTNGGLPVGSELRLAYYEGDPNEPVCEDGLILYTYKTPFEGSLTFSYDVSDIYFNNDRLFIANPDLDTCENGISTSREDCEGDITCGSGNSVCEWNDYYSVDMYYYNTSQRLLAPGDTQITETKINSLYSYGNFMLTGMSEDGCYITLLNEYGISDENYDKLHIGDSFSVYDINYNEENNILTLSCGSNGVLLYSWDGMSLETTLIAHVLSSYAYTAKVFDINKIIVGTEYGVEVYNLGD